MKRNQSALRFSRFCHFIPARNYIALYHALTFKTIFVDQKIAELVKKFRFGIPEKHFLASGQNKELEKLVRKMIAYKMLIPVLDNELEDLQLLSKELTTKPEITGMYLMLTDACNYGCKYCFVQAALPATHKFSIMSEQTAQKAVQCFDRWSNKEFVRSIIFCGGEPLLNRKALVAALQQIGTAGHNNLKLQVITNGSLVDDKFINLAKQYGLKVSVSIDGMAEYHNASRIFQDGRDTHEHAVRGFKMLKNAGVAVGVSMTIGLQHLGHLVENVTWLIDNLGIKSLGFNTLMDTNKDHPVPTEYVEQINCEMIDAFKVLRSLGIYEDRIMRKVESFVEGAPYLHDCSGCGHQMVISPAGKIGVCHGYSGWKKYFVQPQKDFNPLNHQYWQEWVKRSPINMPQCFDCEALGICGGGCACSADIRNGSIWSINENFCIHSKKVLHWMLEEVCV